MKRFASRFGNYSPTLSPGKKPTEPMKMFTRSLDELYKKRCALAAKLRKGDRIEQFGMFGIVKSIDSDKVNVTFSKGNSMTICPDQTKKLVKEVYIPLTDL